jgi:hypothetical protein
MVPRAHPEYLFHSYIYANNVELLPVCANAYGNPSIPLPIIVFVKLIKLENKEAFFGNEL